MTSHYLKMRSSIVKDASELKRINNSTLKDANDKLEEYENGSFNMFHLEK